MRSLRQCRSDDIFNLPISLEVKADYWPSSLSPLQPPIADDYSDPSMSDSDCEEEDSFDFEITDFTLLCQCQLSEFTPDFFFHDDARTLQNDEVRYLVDPLSIERLHGPKIRELRFLLADWLFNVGIHYPATTESIFQSISLLDRFLAKRTVHYSTLQLMSCTCLWITAKVDLHSEDSLDPLFQCCHGKYTKSDFIRSEAEILCAVDYDVHPVTAYFFLRRFLELIHPDPRIELISIFLCESAVLVFDLSGYRPSQIAFCAISAACFQFGTSERLEPLAEFSRDFLWGNLSKCFSLVLKAGWTVSHRDRCFLMKKFGARKFEGTDETGATLIKSVEFGSDLVRCLATLFGRSE
jgi:hypothetical protein